MKRGEDKSEMGPGGHNGVTLSTDAVSKHGHDARRVGRVPTLDRYQICRSTLAM